MYLPHLDEVAQALQRETGQHTLWPYFARFYCVTSRLPSRLTLRPGHRCGSTRPGSHVELLYVHRRVSDGGYGPPDTSAEVVPLIMHLSEDSWRVRNLGYELIPNSGGRPNPGRAFWMSYDPDDVSGLFSEDVAHRYDPYDEGAIVGRDAVVASWLGEVASRGAHPPATNLAPTRPSTLRSRSTVTPLWPPAHRGTANCLAGPSSAPTRTASSCASTAKDAAASSPSTISAAHERHGHRAFGTTR
jgi:hypothetical protein